MKLELGPVRTGYVTPTFGGDDSAPLDPRLHDRMRRPMVVGGLIIGVLVLGLGLWASLTPLASGVAAPGEVAVESSVKTLRHREGGSIRQIFVKEGQLVKAKDPLIAFDETEPRATFEVLQNQADTLMSQVARAEAEATNKPAVQFPPQLTSRVTDPRVAGLIRDQEFLFESRRALFDSQVSVLQQRLQQIENQIEGNRAQVASTNEQSKLTAEEMEGYQTLYAKGYAPKSLILKYQRSMSDLTGRKGSLSADIARLGQQQGETRMQMTSLRNQRQSQAADDLRDSQAKLADVLPRLAVAADALRNAMIRSPVDGTVFNLTQFTPGSAVGPTEVLMQVVPANAPLIVHAMVKPQDVESIHVGMDARVQIAALNPRWHGPMKAKVVMVAPEKSAPPPQPGAAGARAGGGSENAPPQAYYRVDVRIDPSELSKLKRDERIMPGMPASVMLVSGKRTLMGFLVSPITDTLRHAMREE